MSKRLIWFLLILGCLAFWIAATHAAYTWIEARHEVALAECRGVALQATEHNQQLLSRGRFVRQYDPKTGGSVYTFAVSR